MNQHSTREREVNRLVRQVNGYTMALIAYMLGARMVEKHFTLNRALKGTDHAFSLERSGLRRLVRDLKRARTALGDGVKQTHQEEILPLLKMGKSLVAARDLPPGHVLLADDIALRSPGGGTPPYEYENFIGRRTMAAISVDDPIATDNVE